MNLAKYIDHTLLKATATADEIKVLCKEAVEYGFFSVCVNPGYVADAKKGVAGSDVKVCAVVGFPLGATMKSVKVFETKECIAAGADEIDMVINIGFMKSGRENEVYEEIKAIKEAAGEKVVKVIIETCYLTEAEKIRACELSVKAGADFVKTSTGFGTGGATYEDVALMEKTVSGKAFVKASGGVRDLESAAKYVEIGAKRLGTSNGVKIVSGEAVTGGY